MGPFYVIERCLVWLILGFGLLALFSFKRKRFQQVLLVAALSIGSGVLLRLFSLSSDSAGELMREAYFLIAIGAVYGVIWLGARYLGSGRSDPRDEPKVRR